MTSALVAGVAYQSNTDTGSANGTPGKFNFPSGITADSNYYYVADSFNKTIRRINRNTGNVETIAGAAGVGGTADGNGSAARFSWPMDLILSGSTLYVSDYTNHCIRTVDVSSVNFTVTTVLGLCGTSGTTDSYGPAARFNDMTAMEIVGSFMYVSDYGNSTIRKVQLSNMQVTTVAGTAGTTGTADGTGSAVRFHSPWGLSHYSDPVDGDVLFIVDQINHTIRRMKLSDYSVTTVAGSVSNPGFVDAVGLSAKFYQPWGLTNDGQYLYVGDSGNRAVRKVALSDYTVTTFFGGPSLIYDSFGTLSAMGLSAASALHYDVDLGLMGTTQSAVYHVQ